MALDQLHWILGWVLAKFQLSKVQAVVTSNIAGDCLEIACVYEYLLCVDHEVVVTEIAAYDHVTAAHEFAAVIEAHGVALDNCNAVRGAQMIWKLGRITAEASDSGFWVTLEKILEYQTREFAGDAGNADGEGHSGEQRKLK